MFERFTDRARRAVVLAQEESRSFGHDYIGTEHLLLGLIVEQQGIAGQILRAVVTLDGVRDEVRRRVGSSEEVPKGHIPFTPRAKKVLELSLRQALQLDHDYIGPEHILLGLVQEGEGVAAQILLSSVDGGLERVRNDVIATLLEAGVISTARREEFVSIRKAVGAQLTAHVTSDREILTRLEAIEARLSAIERVLREERGDQTA